MLNGPAESRYDADVRAFGLTLHFYSPRAYNYVREKFDKNLPHVGTIRKWYSAAGTTSEPGFCKENLDSLAQLAKKHSANGSQLMCSLIFDEMAIRKHLQWSDSRKKFLGHISYGFRPDFAAVPVATNVIVFMVNGVNVEFNFPIAYYFITSLTADEKIALLKDIVTEIRNCGVRVLNITFDGLNSNSTMCETLGATFEPNDWKPFFKLPGDDNKIYIIYDPSHMLKLMRNYLGNKKFFIDGDGSKIEWKYFESLENFRLKKEFTHVHKLTKKHIQFDGNKMNVRLASETMSNSVANSMEFLRDEGHEQFFNCTATAKFVRLINDIFDTMNSRRDTKKSGFKQAINSQNSSEIFAFFDEAIEYLKNVKIPIIPRAIEGAERKAITMRKAIDSRLRTAFRGLISNMVNLKMCYLECVELKLMECLPTFAFSQDHLESFFGRIRSLNGHNDNPTIEQFNGALRKIIVNDEIKSSTKANCHDSLKLSILNVSSSNVKIVDVRTVDDNSNEVLDLEAEQFERLQRIQREYDSNDVMDASIGYVAAVIEQKIVEQSLFTCLKCIRIIPENDKVTIPISSAHKPCQTTFEICNISHKYVHYLLRDYKYTYENLLSDITCEYNSANAFPKTNFVGHEKHRVDFVNFIISEYIRIQATYFAKQVTLKEQAMLIRRRYKKLVQLAGQ